MHHVALQYSLLFRQVIQACIHIHTWLSTNFVPFHRHGKVSRAHMGHVQGELMALQKHHH